MKDNIQGNDSSSLLSAYYMPLDIFMYVYKISSFHKIPVDFFELDSKLSEPINSLFI